jgi:hypothetical protein
MDNSAFCSDTVVEGTPRACVAFVQPFGLGGEGGGAHLLSTLLEKAPLSTLSIATCRTPPKPTSITREIHVRFRPDFGRIENTRFAGLCSVTDLVFRNSFSKHLERVCRKHQVSAIHAIAHGLDCLGAFDVATRLGIPFFLSVHDDFVYALRGQICSAFLAPRLEELWRNAFARFAISTELAELYCDRYGATDYRLVTDGLSNPPTSARVPFLKKLRVYFMGLVHISYLPNFEALLHALGRFAAVNPDYETSLTIRSSWFPRISIPAGVKFRILPFEPQNPVHTDIELADLLYLPLPFAQSEAAFSRYSLSTKMVTYLGSGVPILYHGPDGAAAARLLKKHAAAQCVFSPASSALYMALAGGPQLKIEFAEAALSLVRSRFRISDILDDFWTPFQRALPCANSTALRA